MNTRIERIESVIHRGAQSVITEGFNDPRLDDCIITVVSVKADRDLTNATVHVSVMPEKAERRVIAGLSAAARHIRRETAERVNVHRMPAFRFKIDASAKRQRGVLDALAQARAEFDDRSAAAAADATRHDEPAPRDNAGPHANDESSTHATTPQAGAAPPAAQRETGQ